ncbi:MAG: hypothetical protein AAGF84_03775 [Planctomycetota bacterium]
MAEFTTSPDVLEAVVAVTEAKLKALNPKGQARAGAPKVEDANKSPRVSVYINGDKGVNHEGYSRRTLTFTVVVVVPDDKSDASLGNTQLLRLTRLYEPIHFDLLTQAKAKTGAFAQVPHVLVREAENGPGIQSDGFDDGDPVARVGCTFEALFNRELPAAPAT